ncbi:TetR/AcrR family transcriptional regulator [Rhodovibrionaceae bacterium A322]
MIEAKQARAQKTRSTLLASAKTLFDSQGFDQVTTEQIARSAGVSKGTLFAHFGDKLGLLAELGQQDLNRQIAGLEQAAETPDDRTQSKQNPIDAIYQGLDGLLSQFETQPEFLRLFIDQTTLRQGIHADVFNAAITRLNLALKALINQHKAQQPGLHLDSDLTSTALRAYLLHLAVGQVCGEYKSREERQETLRQLLTMLLQAG